jgi:hypothetical protein
MGYDDNIFQTPSKGSSFISDVTQVLVDPGNPGGEPIIETREVNLGGGLTGTRDVVVGQTDPRDPVFEDRFTMTPPTKRQGSLATNPRPAAPTAATPAR